MAGLVRATFRVAGFAVAARRLIAAAPVFMGRPDKPGDDEQKELGPPGPQPARAGEPGGAVLHERIEGRADRFRGPGPGPLLHAL